MDTKVILQSAKALILDFDGPVCSLFSEIPASRVASELASVDKALIPHLSTSAKGRDPHRILRIAESHSRDLLIRVEELLTHFETAAASGAEPTPCCTNLVATWKESLKPIAIASNNARGAIEKYLSTAEISVDHIAARIPGQPQLMKPNPDSVRRACRLLDMAPADCVFIGDSLADIQAAHASGVRLIALANKPWKRGKFEKAGAQNTVGSMCEIAALAQENPQL